jgi:hypothetical protein
MLVDFWDRWHPPHVSWQVGHSVTLKRPSWQPSLGRVLALWPRIHQEAVRSLLPRSPRRGRATRQRLPHSVSPEPYLARLGIDGKLNRPEIISDGPSTKPPTDLASAMVDDRRYHSKVICGSGPFIMTVSDRDPDVSQYVRSVCTLYMYFSQMCQLHTLVSLPGAMGLLSSLPRCSRINPDNDHYRSIQGSTTIFLMRTVTLYGAVESKLESKLRILDNASETNLLEIRVSAGGSSDVWIKVQNDQAKKSFWWIVLTDTRAFKIHG